MWYRENMRNLSCTLNDSKLGRVHSVTGFVPGYGAVAVPGQVFSFLGRGRAAKFSQSGLCAFLLGSVPAQRCATSRAAAGADICLGQPGARAFPDRIGSGSPEWAWTPSMDATPPPDPVCSDSDGGGDCQHDSRTRSRAGLLVAGGRGGSARRPGAAFSTGAGART